MTKSTLLTLSVSGALLVGSGGLMTYNHYQKQASLQSEVTTTTQSILPKQALPKNDTATYNIVMVYKDGCQYCDSARKTITKELAKHNDTVVQFTQVDYRSDLGRKLMTRYKAQSVPLIIIIDPNNKTTHSVNDSDAQGVRYLMDHYIFSQDV